MRATPQISAMMMTHMINGVGTGTPLMTTGEGSRNASTRYDSVKTSLVRGSSRCSQVSYPEYE